ncbi:hypothetical protein BKA67DRAFT_218630 [Truncatella angustata]|uniref:C2H2 type master regulator of conidiophore development brlA n=1 Tax=Truncatella angustata TaxID=152316 RepID=A0A9P8UUW7_9PEZI|nr:uncharacterized protein BKA67DRAFT_218630 [Truncatella angustata]KAH6658636.1 hypothetical protein BKA67DRAFT_218630 [Truncatella angustata]
MILESSEEDRLKAEEGRLKFDQQRIGLQLEQCRSHSLRINRLSNNIATDDDETRQPLIARSCPVAGCGKVFRRRRDLRIHYETHMSCLERCVLCVVCPKDFTRASTFIRHFKSHENDARNNERKYRYMLETRNDLRAQAEQELDRLLRESNSTSCSIASLGKRALIDTEEALSSSKRHNIGSNECSLHTASTSVRALSHSLATP